MKTYCVKSNYFFPLYVHVFIMYLVIAEFFYLMSWFKKAKIYVLQYDARDSPIMNRYILFNVAFSLVVQDKHIFDTNDILF